MPRRFEFQVALAIWHPTMAPAAISRRLRMRPSRTQAAGAPRRTPKGQTLDGVHSRSYWVADLTPRGVRAGGRSPEWHASRVGRRLAPGSRFLRRVLRDGGRAVLWISSHGKSNYAIELLPETLGLLAGAGVTLALDVYPNSQNWP